MSYAKLRITGNGVTIPINHDLSLGKSFYSATNVKELLSALTTRRSETPRQGDHGVIGGLSYYGPRFLPFEGKIHATSVSQRVMMEQNLRKCLALPRSQSTEADGHVLIQIEDEDGVEKQIYAKVVEMPEFTVFADGRSAISRYRFALISSDPFLYAQELTEDEGPEAVHVTSFTLQEGSLLTLTEGSLPELQESVSYGISVENDGTIGTPPLITVHGPSVSPVVTNQTTGRSMDFDGLALLTDERLEIDVSSYTVTKIDASDVETDASGYLTAASEWIFIEPGGNELSLLDDSPSVLAASLEVSFRQAWV